MNLNKVFIIGRVTSDIVLKATASNQPVTNFSVATNRTWTDKSGAKQESAEFHNIVCWGRQAEVASQFLTKGGLVMVEGRLQTRTWQDSNNQNRKTTEIVCERLQLGPRSQGQGAGIRQSADQQQPRKYPNTEPKEEIPEELPDVSLDDEIKPEDLPF
ncbi:hypothetical protein A2755_02200 [Candidatus Wolfebacteria bacterium RIFCSPHIGHO2_01_FULL_48_22]|uniref:Single-stranded DNA-binding protein n=2 Tax=Candidatus Wolfeibacteriota TaxID=1752735 RepID=A0A1F8DS18_9BACT|nr:MAG: hypothetical protein A2755_02200 [Candidatus Wolfebacteria bacterium RIFCSPHIGHO2_01_FULL_48_22]OGM92305.1 MAG: hypothetical protein A2935_00870 [Candidatus Wolfebacteria bacterium RIFCSPLOWO2_01_FULL_47_17b]